MKSSIMSGLSSKLVRETILKFRQDDQLINDIMITGIAENLKE